MQTSSHQDHTETWAEKMSSGAQEVQPSAPFTTALYNGFMTRLIQVLAAGGRWYQWATHPLSDVAPTLVKTYSCRPSLTVRYEVCQTFHSIPKSHVDLRLIEIKVLLSEHMGPFFISAPAMLLQYPRWWVLPRVSRGRRRVEPCLL